MITPELIPRTAWGKNVRAIVSQAEWDVIRRTAYANAGYCCVACGASECELHAHEQWEWIEDGDERIQKLVAIVALCRDCHNVKHYFRSINTYTSFVDRLTEGTRLVHHACRVNGWDHGQFINYLHKAITDNSTRERYEWKLDVSMLEDFIASVGRYKIGGHVI